MGLYICCLEVREGTGCGVRGIVETADNGWRVSDNGADFNGFSEGLAIGIAWRGIGTADGHVWIGQLRSRNGLDSRSTRRFFGICEMGIELPSGQAGTSDQ